MLTAHDAGRITPKPSLPMSHCPFSCIQKRITCPSYPQPAAVWQRRAARCGPFWGCLYCCHLRGRPWRHGRSQGASCVAASASCARWSKACHCDSDSHLQQQHLMLSTEFEFDGHGQTRVDNDVKRFINIEQLEVF